MRWEDEWRRMTARTPGGFSEESEVWEGKARKAEGLFEWAFWLVFLAIQVAGGLWVLTVIVQSLLKMWGWS